MIEIFSIDKERNFQSGAPSTPPRGAYGKPPGFPGSFMVVSMYAGPELPAMGIFRVICV